MAEAIAGALVQAFGSAAFGWGAAYTVAYTVVIGATVEYSKYSQRKAQARARAAANASAKDREVMIRSALAPRRIIYGRDRVSGPIFYMESTGDKGQYLHLCVALAAHECDGIDTIYFNEEPLPTEDGSGFVTTGNFVKPGRTMDGSHTGTTTAGGEITLPQAAISVLAAYTETGGGEGLTQTQYTGWAHTSGTATVTGLPASTLLTVGYTYQEPGVPLVRIRRFLGTADQLADADLVAESAGLWTSAHRARGICYLYVRLEYDQEVWASVGVPNISAVVRGKKVYDPRTSTTGWSDNAALCVADWLRSAEGLRAAAGEVPDAEITAAANICDEEIDLDAGGATTQARYTCNTSITTDQSPRDALAALLACMAGRAVWTQGRWLVRPGAYRTPTLTITADMLAGALQIMPRVSRSDLYNAVRATYRDPDQAYAEVQAPLVTNAGYEAQDGGVQIVRQIDVPTLADTYRAQRLAKVELERARQALTVRLTCNLAAYDLAPTDTVMLTLATYGFVAKPFEVVERTISPEGLLQYTLRETAAGVWDWAYGEATVGDLAPNTVLPTPFGLPGVLANLTATERAVLLGDGTLVTQALLEWDASTAPFVSAGGRIDVQTARSGEPFGSMSLPGDSTSVLVGPLQAGISYVARVRAVGATGRAGDWAYVSLVAQGLSAAPADVTGLAYAIKPSQVQLTWDPCPDADYAATELRVDGAGWADAAFLWRGAGTEYHHPRPPNGTYTVRAKHLDASGSYSAAAANLSVTVDDTIDPTAAGATLLQLVATGFAFVFDDESATTSASPTITFDAILKNVAGSVTWTVTAYDAAGSSLGTLTLGGSGNTGRTLTAANFNSLGATTTRYVKVEATLGSLSDTTTIYRGDGGSDALNLVVSNESHTVPTAADGTGGSYSGASTAVLMYQGISDVTALWTFAIVASGCTATINGGAGPVSGTGTITVAVSAMSADAATVTINATRSGYPAQSKVFSLAKSKAGNEGVGIQCVATAQAFAIDQAGSVTPSSIIVSVTRPGGLSVPAVNADYTWSVVAGTFTGSLSTINSSTGAFPSFGQSAMSTDAVTFRCEYEPTSGAYDGQEFSDYITIIKVREGVTISGYLTNENHTVPADSAGTVSSWSGCSGTFKVYSGSAEVTASCTFSTVSSSGWSSTPSAPTAGTGAYSFSGSPSMTADVATVTYRASYTHPTKGAVTLDKVFTASKSKAGTNGSNGSNGTAGVRGSLDLYISGSSPLTSAECDSAVLAQTGSSTKVVGDTVTESNGSTYVDVLRWNGSSWVDPGVVIDGSLLVTGTVTAAKLAANAIRADNITTDTTAYNGISFAVGSSAAVAGYNGACSVISSSSARWGLLVANTASTTGAGGMAAAVVNGSSYAGAFYNSTSTAFTSHRTSAEFCTNERGATVVNYTSYPTKHSEVWFCELGNAIEIKSGMFRYDRTPETGAGTANFSGTKPGGTQTNSWLRINVSGTDYLIPIWLAS